MSIATLIYSLSLARLSFFRSPAAMLSFVSFLLIVHSSSSPLLVHPLYPLLSLHRSSSLCFAIPSALLPLVQFASLGSAYYTPRRSFFSLGLNRRSGSLTHSRPPALSFLSFAPLSTVHSPRSVSFGALCLFRQTIRSVGKRLTNHDFGFTARCLSYCRAGKPKT